MNQQIRRQAYNYNSIQTHNDYTIEYDTMCSYSKKSAFSEALY